MRERDCCAEAREVSAFHLPQDQAKTGHLWHNCSREREIQSFSCVHFPREAGMGSETYRHYWEKGWAVEEGVFSREEADRIARIALDLSQQELRDDGDGYVVDKSDDGEIAPRKIDRPFLKKEEFQTFILDRRLTKLLAELLGAAPLLSGDQIFMKPPQFGSAKPYHQDNFYFQCDPGDHVITAWIALDDVGKENGCLRYIDGSHKGPILPHESVPRRTVQPGAATGVDRSAERVAGPRQKGGCRFSPQPSAAYFPPQ